MASTILRIEVRDDLTSVAYEECFLKETSECGTDEDCEGLTEYKYSPFSDVPETKTESHKLTYICEGCQCVGYECFEDEDCPDGYTCEEGTCVPPECLTDEDCPQGYYCDEYSCVQEEEPGEPEEEPGEEAPVGPGEEPEEEQPPFMEPEEVAKEVIPLLEETAPPQDEMQELWDTMLSGVWCAVAILLLVALAYILLKRRKRKAKE